MTAASAGELQAQALAALREGDLARAETCYRSLLALQRHPGFLNNLGLVLAGQRRHAEAVAVLEEAVRARPADANARLALSSALLFCARPAEALEHCDRILRDDPRRADARHNRGVALGALNRNAEAIEAFAALLAENPDDADAEFNLGVNELLLGRYDMGWRHYEARWRGPLAIRPLPHAHMAAWTPGQPLEGRAVLALAEQGLGDTLHFARWLPRLRGACGHLDLQVQPALVALLRRHFPMIPIEPLGAAPRDHAALRLPLMSLPLALGLGAAFNASASPYLCADQARLAEWSARFPTGRRRLGIAFQGSRTHRRQATRSIPLALLAPWLDAAAAAGVEVVLLHNDLIAAEREFFAPRRHVQVPALADFDDTAAVLALVDHVVSVDTAVLHLAGAMGRPSTALLPYAPDFRWQLDRSTCGPYPTMRLLRQPSPGDWAGVLRQLAEDLT